MDLIKRKYKVLFKAFVLSILLPFLGTTFIPVSYAQSALNLPQPGAMVSTSPAFIPPVLKGLIINPEQPFQFDFILDSGDSELTEQEVREESTKLIKYFLASLTMPEDELWVNLSPYEKDRIIPNEFGKTEMGRDLLAQDYLLKQLTASLIYPEDDFGKKFWDKVYEKANKFYGTSEIPVNTFNKVWIVPDKALIYENVDRAFVVETRLKVMLEEDYLALEHNSLEGTDVDKLSEDSSSIIREVIIPEIEKEVNNGKNFSKLRQIYHSFILASWYKKNLHQSLLSKAYADQKKIIGLETEDKNAKGNIYQQYLEAFEKGVYDFIREDYDETTQELIPRKYFSGGAIMRDVAESGEREPKSSGQVYRVPAGLRDPTRKQPPGSPYRVFEILRNAETQLTALQIAEQLNLSVSTVQRDLSPMVKRGLVERIGPANSEDTLYKVSKKASVNSNILSDRINRFPTYRPSKDDWSRVETELERVLNLSDRSNAVTPQVIGVFPSFGSISFYNELGSTLYDTGIPEIQSLYSDAAKSLGLTDSEGRPDPSKIFFQKDNIPTENGEKKGFLAAAFMAHNLALNIYLRVLAERQDMPVNIKAYTGESYGITTSAVASGAISVEEGIKLGQFIFTTVAEESERQEPNHIFTIRGLRANKALETLMERFPDKVEAFKYYSESPIYEYKVFVDNNTLEEFESFVGTTFTDDDVEVSLLQANNRFSSHTRNMAQARIAVEEYIEANVTIKDPEVPIISNNNTGIILTAEEVRQAIFSTINVPMYSSKTVKMTKGFGADVVIELGMGGKALKTFVDNGIEVPSFPFEGEESVPAVLVDVTSKLKSTAYKNVVEPMAEQIIGKRRSQETPKPVVISLDGISGAGKTTVISVLMNSLIEEGYNVMVDEDGNAPSLDMFLRDREWRVQETSKIIEGKVDYDNQIDFFDWEAIEKFYQDIQEFIASGDAETTIVIENSYDNRSKTYRARSFRLTREMIVLVEGNYANRNTIADLKYRIDNQRASEQFVERIRRLSPDIYDGIVSFFQYALVPSYSKYSGQYDVDHYINLSSTEPEDWIVEDAAMVSEGDPDVGGIDFNPNNFKLQSQGNKVEILLPSNLQDYQNLEINGLVPFIFNITPIPSLPLLLSESEEESEEINLSIIN